MSEVLSVGDVHRRVRSAVAREFRGSVWVVGEVGRVEERTGALYGTLVEADAGWNDGDLSIAFAVPRARWNRIRAELAAAGAALTIGRQARLFGTVTVWDRGQLQFSVAGVDVADLVGQRAAERARLLATLTADGLVGRNAGVPFPALPLRIGLVTSRDSDGYRDFCLVLGRSPYAFSIRHLHAPVQGPGAGDALARAVTALAGRVDVIAVVRGGGTDLDAFDSEALARAVAACPVPVVAGVGHTADRSICDLVAHQSTSTPTGAAQFLVAAIASAEEAVASRAGRLAATGAAHTGRQSDRIADRAVRLARVGATVPVRAEEHLVRATGSLTRLARSSLERAEAALTKRAGLLAQAARRAAAQATNDVTARQGVLAAHDPARVLSRGYSITRDPTGRALTSTAALSPGDALHTIFAVGTARSTVTATGPANVNNGGNGRDEAAGVHEEARHDG